MRIPVYRKINLQQCCYLHSVSKSAAPPVPSMMTTGMLFSTASFTCSMADKSPSTKTITTAVLSVHEHMLKEHFNHHNQCRFQRFVQLRYPQFSIVLKEPVFMKNKLFLCIFHQTVKLQQTHGYVKNCNRVTDIYGYYQFREFEDE